MYILIFFIVGCAVTADSSLSVANTVDNIISRPDITGACILPPYPEHGSYIVSGRPYAVPGQAFDTVVYNVTCHPGYYINGKRSFRLCFYGIWVDDVDECVPYQTTWNCQTKDEWRCEDGACVSPGSKCNGVRDCPDGSDEWPATCGTKQSVEACILPPYPDFGTYTVPGVPDAKPGQVFDTVAYDINCFAGYDVIGARFRVCYKGTWFGAGGRCGRFCKLNEHPSVEYRCVLEAGARDTRACGEYEPDGTLVDPRCRTPIYYSSEVLGYMRCTEGSWDYVAQCQPECGLVSPEGRGLIAGPEAHAARRGELPWHAGVYLKVNATFNKQICGGSLVSEKLVISAAHCFWQRRKLPASKYAVALGKIHRDWSHEGDKEENVQRADVESIHMPLNFRGGETNFQQDFAILVLNRTIAFDPFIMPVCLSFDEIFEKRQLSDGRKGKVAGWGLTSPKKGSEADTLRTIELPYISVDICLNEAREDFRVYITGDKFCAGFRNGSAVCHGDSGGGLAFSERDERGYERYYLRGVVSTAASGDDVECNVNWLTTFTQVSSHKQLIKSLLPAPQGTGSRVNDACVLPPYPEHGTYEVSGVPSAKPGQAFATVSYYVICRPGYKIHGDKTRLCYNGLWVGEVARCVLFCKLPKDETAKYCCITDSFGSSRVCGEYEPDMTVVKPVCRRPHYYTPRPLAYMHCYNGKWNYVARCQPECGRLAPVWGSGVAGLIARTTRRGEIPWAAAIFRRTEGSPFIGRGNLVRANVVISAAHIFWERLEDKQVPYLSKYSVAVGKQYWKGDDDADHGYAQFSDVLEVYLPAFYQGSNMNFRGDISVIKLKDKIKFNDYIMPICVMFDVVLKREHLKDGITAKVAGWGLTESNDSEGGALRTMELSLVPIRECRADAPPGFRPYLAGDKLCSGHGKGSAVCPGDSGGGLAFPQEEGDGSVRYYLRGVASVGPRDEKATCTVYWLTAFTHVTKH